MKYIILLGLLAFSAYADTCASSALATALGITRLSDSIAVDDTLPFCKNLKTAGKSCCSVETVTSIQTKIDEMKTQLETIMKSRD